MAPRLSIIPGDFAEDLRADEAHFRVLNLIGRHTDQSGWCRLKQIGIANAIKLTRETVNRKIRDLVDWGYVEKRSADATGRAIYYRTVLDRPAPLPPVAAADLDPMTDDEAADACETSPGPVNDGSHVGYNASGELHTTCDPRITSGVIPTITPGVIVYDHTERTSLTTSPPKSPNGGLQSSNLNSKQGSGTPDLVAALRARLAGRHADAVEHFIAPLVASGKRLSLGRDAVDALVEIAGAAHGIPRPALAAAVERLKAQATKATVRAIRAELDTARAAGALVVIRKGSAQWARWSAHFDANDPQQGRTMARFDVWQVPSEWPPASASAAPAANGRAA